MLGEFVKTNARLDALPLLVARLDALEQTIERDRLSIELKLDRAIIGSGGSGGGGGGGGGGSGGSGGGSGGGGGRAQARRDITRTNLLGSVPLSTAAEHIDETELVQADRQMH